MGARIRLDGTIVCAAMHPELDGDYYLDDEQLYKAVEAGEIEASPTHLHKAECDTVNCSGATISASGSPVCGDGIWVKGKPRELDWTQWHTMSHVWRPGGTMIMFVDDVLWASSD